VAGVCGGALTVDDTESTTEGEMSTTISNEQASSSYVDSSTLTDGTTITNQHSQIG